MIPTLVVVDWNKHKHPEIFKHLQKITLTFINFVQPFLRLKMENYNMLELNLNMIFFQMNKYHN